MSYTATYHTEVYDFIDPRTTLRYAASGKSVMITGAGRGIGQSIAESFTLAGAAMLLLISRTATELSTTESLCKNINPFIKIHILPFDVTKSEHVKKIGEFMRKHCAGGCPDILVNNAGVSAKVAEVGGAENELEDEWWNVMEVNLKGLYLLSREFIKAVKEVKERAAASKNDDGVKGPKVKRDAILSKEYTIINSSSMSSYYFLPGMSSYQISKVAVNKFTQFVDAEHSKDGIRCLAFHPGAVYTSMVASCSYEMVRKFSTDSRNPTHPTTAYLAGATCVYLTTERANFLKGRYLSANWDMKELEDMKPQIVKEDLLKMVISGVTAHPLTA